MRRLLPALAVAVLSSTAAHASLNLVTNGGFEQTTLSQSQQFTNGQITGWSNAQTNGYTGWGYNFLIKAGTADTTGFYSLYGNHDYLWGPGGGTRSANYSNNGLPSSSPTGGNYLIADGDSNFRGAISQTISGLTTGTAYQLTFDWAAGEFAGYSAQTTEAWSVSFGNTTKSTATVTTPGRGFSPWTTATMTFVATAPSQVLSFLAMGTPNGEPPTLLLDNVSLTAAAPANVPEPGTLALMAGGLAAVGFVSRRRRHSNAAE